MERIAEGYAKIKELKYAEVGAGSDLFAVRKAIPGVFLNARYSPVKLVQVTAQELREDIEKLKYNGAMAISCVGIDSSVTDERIIEFISICKEC